jgi:3-deoxy-7-phosphoheptulonate synthase
MIIVKAKDIRSEEEEGIKLYLANLGFTVRAVNTKSTNYLVAVGGKAPFDIRSIGALPGVLDVFTVDEPYQLVSRSWRVGRSKIHIPNPHLDNLSIGEGNKLALMLGPCSVETPEQMECIGKYLQQKGVRIMRGGAFKPRTSPYTFRGLGVEGLRILREVGDKYGLSIISEVLEPSQIATMYPYIDIFQVGARNNQNFSLLHELGLVDKPILVKRGVSGSIAELLQAAEYIYANGNERLILCERGIRTFENAYRNTLDLNAVPILQDKSHLPVVVDPSHGIGIRKYVSKMAVAAAAVGADGLLIEIGETPEQALSDGDQTLNFSEASKLLDRLTAIGI